MTKLIKFYGYLIGGIILLILGVFVLNAIFAVLFFIVKSPWILLAVALYILYQMGEKNEKLKEQNERQA